MATSWQVTQGRDGRARRQVSRPRPVPACAARPLTHASLTDLAVCVRRAGGRAASACRWLPVLLALAGGGPRAAALAEGRAGQGAAQLAGLPRPHARRQGGARHTMPRYARNPCLHTMSGSILYVSDMHSLFGLMCDAQPHAWRCCHRGKPVLLPPCTALAATCLMPDALHDESKPVASTPSAHIRLCPAPLHLCPHPPPPPVARLPHPAPLAQARSRRGAGRASGLCALQALQAARRRPVPPGARASMVACIFMCSMREGCSAGSGGRGWGEAHGQVQCFHPR